jgi:CHAD domain-containing protein
MQPSGKWIDGIDAGGTVEDAARRSLQARLTSVIHALPLAAHLADHDVEHVHRLRVATRRAIAALKLYRESLPRKSARWLKKRLKKIRRAAGDARDIDVLGAHLVKEYGERAAAVAEVVAARRANVQTAIVDVAESCRHGDRLVRKVSKLLAGIESQSGDEQAKTKFGEWAELQLSESSRSFFDALPGESSDTTALHEFRIRGKELRYTIELVVAAFGPELRDEVYPVVEKLQERLGDVQDHVTAIATLCEWANDAGSADLQASLRELAEEERESLIDAVGDFRNWWTHERVETLRTGLAHVAQTDTVTDPQQAAHQT